MPTYSYRCTQCEHAFDAIQPIAADALTECPECGGRLRKQFGVGAIAFKGSGFYRTDSTSSGASGSGAKAAQGASSPAASGSTSPTGAAATSTSAAAGS